MPPEIHSPCLFLNLDKKFYHGCKLSYMCNCALLVSRPDEFIFGVVLSWTRSVGSLEAEFLASLIFSFFSTAVGLRVDLSRTFSVM